MPNKELIIAAGPNGSGKSTYIADFLKRHSWPYVSADLIATQLDIKEVSALQFAAGQEFIRQMESLLRTDQSFIVETTMAGRTWKSYMEQARAAGFEITIYFVYLDSADTCIARVKERVRRGGHDVSEADIRRRYARALSNFWTTYRKIADHWAMVYNAGGLPIEVAFGYGVDFAVSDEVLFERFLEMAGVEKDG